MAESDPEVSGMETGSDAGAPGDHLPDRPLTEDEQELLAALQAPADGSPIEAVEDSPAMAQAVEDDSPLPGAGQTGQDPDTPRFQPPPG